MFFGASGVASSPTDSVRSDNKECRGATFARHQRRHASLSTDTGNMTSVSKVSNSGVAFIFQGGLDLRGACCLDAQSATPSCSGVVAAAEGARLSPPSCSNSVSRVPPALLDWDSLQHIPERR